MSKVRLAVVDWAKYRSQDSKLNAAGEDLAKRLDGIEQRLIDQWKQNVTLKTAERIASGEYGIADELSSPERSWDEVQADEAGMPRFGPI